MNKHTRIWQLQEAKARFSEVVRLAQTEGPQLISLHGKVVVEVKKRIQPSEKLSGRTGLDLAKSLQMDSDVEFEIPDWETEGEFRDVVI